jgi:hypothetical protein
MVRAGTALIVEVTGTAGSWWNPSNAFVTENGIVADVRAGLLPYVYVDGIVIDDRGISDVVEWDYRAQARIRPKADYGDANDLASIVAHEFYEATGYLPSATIGPGSQPPLDPPIFDPGAILSRVQGTASLLIIGIVVIVGLIAFSGAVKVKL